MTDYQQYVGGKAGTADQTLSPVQIGWVNQQGGANDLAPEATSAAEFSVKYVNDHLGGIQGHPLKLVECTIPDTVAAASQCGQQMANNSAVKVVAPGPITVGNEAFESAIAPTSKPLVFGVGASEQDVSYSPGFLLFGDSLHLEGPFATYIAQDLKAKQVAIIYENIPGASVSAQVVANGLKILGINSKVVAFDPSAPDLTAPLTASGAASADALVPILFGNYCVTLNKALTQLNIKTPVVTNVTCISADIIKGDGGTLPPWTYAVGGSLAADASDPSGAALTAVAKLYNAEAQVSDIWFDVTFSQILTITKFLDQVGSTGTSAQITSAAQAYKGPLLWGPATLVCGKYKDAPSVCNDQDQFFTFVGPTTKRVQAFIGPPPGLTVPTT